MAKSDNAVKIYGRSQTNKPVSAGAATVSDAVLDASNDSLFDVWCDTDVWIKVAADPSNVTVNNGYKILANNVVTVEVKRGCKLGGITQSGSGTLSWHQIG